MDLLDSFTGRLAAARAKLIADQTAQTRALNEATQRFATDGAASLIEHDAAVIAAEKEFELALAARLDQFLGGAPISKLPINKLPPPRESSPDPDAEAKARVDEAEAADVRAIAETLAPDTQHAAE